MQHGFLPDLIQDLRVCLRSLLRSPVLTLTIVLTVGLGIGGTTVIFAAVNAVLLRPLPYAQPDRLVRIYTDHPPNRFPFSVVDYFALRDQHTQFEQIAGYATRPMAFTDGEVAERLRGRLVSWTYFSVLGIKPAIGRDFTEADGWPGSTPAVIVSDRFWRERLRGRMDVLGMPIRLEGVDHTLTGVLPRSVGPLEQDQEFFAVAQWDTPPRKGPFFITVIARLRDGTARAAAADELRAINRRIFPLWKTSYQEEGASWGMMDLKAHVIGTVETMAGLAMAAVALVWLIACANASSLLVARITSRRRELAVRAALGASRARVVRYLMAESSLLALGASAVGIALAWVGVGLLGDIGSRYLPRTQEIALNGPVLAVLAAVTAASALLFGLVPAVHGTGGPVDESLRSMGRSSTGSLGVRRLRRVLVGSQFAIATPLLVVAGLLIASLEELRRVDLGFDSRNMLSGSIVLSPAQYPEPGQVTVYWDELQRRIEALPEISGFAFADGRPPNEVNNFNNFDLEDSPAPPGGTQPVAPWIAVSPEYFRLLGLTLLEGRLFDERDGLQRYTDAIIVDRTWATRFFPNESAVGKRLREGGCTTCPWTTVIGIVSDVKYAGLDKPDQGSVYSPMPARGVLPDDGTAERFRYLMVRTRTNPEVVLPTVRRIVRDLDPSLPLSNVSTVDDLVTQSLQTPRSLSLLVGGFALIALILSVVGIYGVMTYYVQQHSKDISIRLALGGSSSGVFRLIVSQGMKVVIGGVVIGLLSAIAITRLMSSLLFGIGATDAFTLTVVTALLLAVALVACIVPARRAIGIEPAAVLRDE